MEALIQTCKSFCVSPCTLEKMSNLIKKLKINKAKRTSDIESKFVKYAHLVISVFLSKLLNSCISDGTYPNSRKVAKVILVLKKVVAVESLSVHYGYYCSSTYLFFCIKI